MAGPDNFRLFFIAQIAGREEQSLGRLVKNVARNVKFRLSSALKKCVLKPFISFYLSAELKHLNLVAGAYMLTTANVRLIPILTRLHLAVTQIIRIRLVTAIKLINY